MIINYLHNQHLLFKKGILICYALFRKFTFNNFTSPVGLAIPKFYLPGLNFTSLGHRACTIFRRLALSENYKPIHNHYESLNNSDFFGVYFIKIEAKMTKLCCFEKMVCTKYIAKNELVRILFARYCTSCIALISQTVNHMYTPTKLESVLGYKNCGFSSFWLSIHLFIFCPGCNWENTGS